MVGNSALELKYSKYTIQAVCDEGSITSLEWWEKSGLKFEYDSNTIDMMSYNWFVTFEAFSV